MCQTIFCFSIQHLLVCVHCCIVMEHTVAVWMIALLCSAPCHNIFCTLLWRIVFPVTCYDSECFLWFPRIDTVLDMPEVLLFCCIPSCAWVHRCRLLVCYFHIVVLGDHWHLLHRYPRGLVLTGHSSGLGDSASGSARPSNWNNRNSNRYT